MLGQLIEALVRSPNDAADDVLLEALRIGTDAEKGLSLNALLRRETTRGLCGVLEACFGLPPSLQQIIVREARHFHSALRECARSEDRNRAVSAMRLISQGRQGKLTYLLTEGLHSTDDAVAKAAVEGLVLLARWVSTETRKLAGNANCPEGTSEAQERARTWTHLVDERPEIEQAIARALDVHRGRYGAELARAALMLADSPASRTLAILSGARHGGQSGMLRRLQQPPEAEFVEAFLLSASHMSLRTTFGVIFGHISEPAALDSLLPRTHWLKDHQLHLCMRQVNRGVWCGEAELERDLSRRDNRDVASVCAWIAASGLHDVVQDQKFTIALAQLKDDTAARLRVLQILTQRARTTGGSIELLRAFLNDPDERLARLAAREIVRRRPPEYEHILMQALSGGAGDSVRRVIGRSAGRAGFELFWERWNQLDAPKRRSAGRAMLKLLPVGLGMLERRMRSGPVEQRLKAIAISQELDIADQMAGAILFICTDASPKIRSKAVALLANLGNAVSPGTESPIYSQPALDRVLQRVLHDSDPRVRANAVDVLGLRQRISHIPLLTERAGSADNSRERANAVRALFRLRAPETAKYMATMLQDERPDHRVSGIWLLRQIGAWNLLPEVGRLAKQDTNMRVRRYAMQALRALAEKGTEAKARPA